MTANGPKYPIGLQYRTRYKSETCPAGVVCTVTDILRTYNAAGELVRLRYVATHEFIGQRIVDADVTETTIAMALAADTHR